MGKVVKGALKVVGAVAAVASVVATAGASLGFIAAGSSLFGLGISAAAFSAIAAGSALATGIMGGGSPQAPQSATQLGRLQASLDTQAPRKMVLGRTAFPADIRYYEGSGEDEKTIEYIIAVAAHKVREITELWIEDELAWSATGGIAAQFVDYLGVEGYTEGSASNTRAINGGARWGSDDRLTGCAYLYVRVERLGVSEDEQSPFANGLPGRVTIIGEGMPMYDPRFDSTVGGSGSMRVDNQLTWGPSSGNPIIQSLNVLLGWRINGKLSVGGGLPAKYIDLDSVMTAANMCDEDIVLSGGGTQPRYRTAGAFSTDDAPMAIVASLLSGCAGDLLDSDGRLSFLIKTNTLATPVVTFDDHDILSAASWDPMGGQTNLPNIISGTFTDPSPNSLYQPVPYPSVSLPSEDGIERTAPLDLGVVENAPQAERLAKQTLQRMQYPGLFTAEYNMKGMAAKVGTIVWQTLSPRGWVNKPFRVVSQKPSRSGRIALVLREEHEDIYAWAAEDSASVQPAEPVRFDPRNTGPILLARKAAEKANWSKVKDDDPVARPRPDDGATVGAPPGTPVGDRPAEDVVSAIDLHTTHLADLDTSVGAAQGDIDSLFATYGDTASAAQSAADAAASLTTVQGIEDHIDAQKLLVDQARVAAEAAEQGATDQAGFASADRQLAQTARGGAESARDTALIARDTAQGHAATATTQATISTSSSNSARRASLATYSTRTDTLDDFTHYDSATYDPRDPLAAPPAFGNIVNDPDLGPTIEQSALLLGVRAPMPCVPGRKYRVRMATKFPSGANRIRLVIYPKTADNTTLPLQSMFGTEVAAGGISLIDTVLDCDTYLASQPDAAYLFLRPQYNSGGAAAASLTGRVFIEDVTESEKAGEAASAALVSSSTATTKASEAANSASVATTQAGIATTKAGDATTQAGFAQQYKADAEAAADDSQSYSLASAASALTASSGSDSARLAALSQYSTRTDSLDDWYNNQPSGYDPRAPLLAGGPGAGAQVVNDPDLGPTIEQTSLGLGVRAPMPCIPGRKYRVRMSSRFTAGVGRVRLLVYPKTADNTTTASTSIFGNQTVTAGEISSIDAIIDCDTILASQPTTAYVTLVSIPSGGTTATRTGKVFIEDVTESELAEASASAAVISASTASTKADEATGAAATATTQAGLSVAAKNDSETAAGVSTTQAAIATDKAAASQTIFENVASLRSNALHKNAGFDDYPSASVGAIPTGWGTGAVNIGAGYRVPGPTGGYSWRLPAAANVEVYGRQDSAPGSIKVGEQLVIAADITLNTGSLISSGALVTIRDAAGNSLQSFSIDFWLDDDSTGAPPSDSGSIPGPYRFEKPIKITHPDASYYSIYPMTHWTGFAGGFEFASDITWHECTVRPPTAADASVGIITGAIVGPGGPAAFLEQVVAASGSTPAKYQMLAGQDGSRIGLVADVISLGNDVDGIIEDVLVVENGQARISAALIRELQVPPTPTSEIFHDVMLKPRIYIGGDGDTIQYQGGASYGANPARIDPDLSGLPALAEGESYDVKAVSITPTQFTARAKKVSTPVDVTQQSNAGTNKGSGVDPRWQTNKPTTANAHDGYYEFTFFGTVPKTSQQGPDGGYYYRGSVTLKGRTSAGWQVLENVQITRYLAGGLGSYPPFTNFSQTEMVQSSADLGSGADRFGVQPSTGTTITAFDRVRYVTRTSASTTAITNDIRWTVYPPGNG